MTQHRRSDPLFDQAPAAPYFQHPTVHAVAQLLYDRRYAAQGGVQLLRRCARIRQAVAGTANDEDRVSLAIQKEGWVPTDELVEEVIRVIQRAADDMPH